MRFKALIFDMDGTIIDTEHMWIEASRSLVLSYNKPFTKELHEELSKNLRGKHLATSIAELKKLTGIDEHWEVLGKKKIEFFLGLLARDVEFIPGFEVFFEKVKNSGLKFAIATNSDDVCVKIVAQSLHLDRFFADHIYTIQHVNGNGKPKPDIYIYAAQQLGVKPQDCLVIEDSKTGIEAAVRAGMTVIGINTGKDLDQLQAAHAIVENYSEIDLEQY